MSKLRKRAIPILIITILLTSIFAVAIPIASAAEDDLAVDRYSSTMVWEATYATIQAAIDAASDGDIIEVSDDISPYTEDLTIDVDNVELRPETGDTVVLKGLTPGVAPLGTTNLFIDADGVSVHGFTVQPATTTGDHYVTMIHVHGEDAEIYDNIFTLAAIHTDDELVGIVSTQTVDVSGLNIHDNTFTATIVGIAWLEGIYINLNAGTGTVTIEDNTFSGDLLRAICTEHDDTTITGNTITGDLVGDATFALGEGYAGIQVGGTVATVANVDITNNDVTGGFQSAIRLSNSVGMSAISVSENTLEDNWYAVYVADDADEVEVHQNNIYDLINNLDTGVELDAVLNWWGTDVESAIEAMAGSDVDYDPWLTGTTGTKTGDLSIDNVKDEDGIPIDWGDKGDEITVVGSGVTAGETVKLGWDGLQAWDGEDGVLNSTTAKGDGSFSLSLDVPEAVVGLHYIWVKDMDTGDTTMWAGDFAVKPKISLSPDSGLEGDSITISGYGFDAEVDVDDIQFEGIDPDDFTTSPAVPETDELGSWECTFKVPLLGYDPYDVEATDEEGNWATDEFTYGASITLDPSEGPVGTVVEIEGVGFTEGEKFDSTEVKINGVTCYITKEDTVGSNGEFRIEVVIPQTDDEDLDEYKLYVTEDDPTNDETANAKFDVIGLAEIDLDPEFGVQGTTVTIEGWNFTQISGEEITIILCEYDNPSNEIYDITDDLDTESNGEFSGTFIVPARSSDQYTIKAIMEDPANDYNIEAYASFRIGLMIVIPTPSSGPTGTMVTISGTGFTIDEAWNATFGDYTIIEDGTVDAESDLEIGSDVIPTFYVPTVDPGTYTISVYDIDSEIAVDVDWTVTATTMVEMDPVCAPNGYNVSITGSYFNADSELKDIDLEFVLYNVTSDGETDEQWDIDVYTDIKDPKDTITTVLDKDGNFTGYWIVLDDETLSCGDYILNVTADEADNIMAQTPFRVCAKSIDVEPRKPIFARGETVAFNIKSSFVQVKGNEYSYIEIYDPNGDLYWTTDEFTDGVDTTVDMWLKVGEFQTVPYYYQTAGGNSLFLLEDAPIGTWSWEWVDWDDDVLDSGTFKVDPAAADVLSTQLTELSGDLAELATDFASVSTDVSSLASDVSSLSSSVAQAIAAANAASDAVSDVAAAVASVADTAANAATAATSAAAAATSAKEAADTAGAAASGLTNLVYGAIVASLVAALAAIVSLMQISKKIA